jgi:hypothetical protein
MELVFMNKIVLILFAFFGYLYADENLEKYTVKEGDYLCRIARKYYSDCDKWKLLYEANKDKIKNPDLILPGWILDIPLISTKTYQSSIDEKIYQVEIKEIESQEKQIKTDNSISTNNSNVSIYTKDILGESSSISISSFSNLTSSSSLSTSSISSGILVNLKGNDKKNENFKPYQIVRKNLSKSLPVEQVTFNISSDRFEVKKDFFCGKVVGAEKESEFYVRNDVIDIKSDFKLGNDIKELFIYSIVSNKDDKIIADKIAKCDIVLKNNLDIKCIIDWFSFPVKKGMKVSIYGSK